ncbi:MAG TPA: YhbY family RNA-binding protein [Steroidobacteraceae bacterium]|jgi:RNA-binding protein|nr:YhbY family RNA-binding protein [Steroidobacteraceae bacterium]
MKLSEKQRKHLRGLGHSLKPIILVGQAGATDGVVAEATRALHDHELVKVRVSGMERDARDETLATLASRTESELVGRIGHTALLYRRNPERPRILLPS